ncbi:spermatogenesis associated 2-like [Narcine bancroftii]|uniref:spermatogenesis associated 2-like n=1 Tax=Narcine bancroftii TaxID=1343680 RepID=UPI003831935B
MTTELQFFFEQYEKFHQDGSLGHNGICHDKDLKEQLKQWLIIRGADLANVLWVDVHEIIAKSPQRSQHYPYAFKKLIKAFELLELAAANLFLYPWRKEFKTIKTFSGGYVYFLKPTISHEDLERIFMKMGYQPKDNLELEMKDLPDSLQLIRLAFNFFVARIECEIFLEVDGKPDHSKNSVEEMLCQRKLMTPGNACVNNLFLTSFTAESQTPNQIKRTLTPVSSGEDTSVDLRSISSVNNQANAPSQRGYNGSAHSSLKIGLHGSSVSDQSKMDKCSKQITGISSSDCFHHLTAKDSTFEESQDHPKGRLEIDSASNLNIASNNFDRKPSASYCSPSHTMLCDSTKYHFKFFEAENSHYPQQADSACSILGQSSPGNLSKMDPTCKSCKDLPMYICHKCSMYMCKHCGYKNMLKCKKCDNMFEKFKS